MSISIVRVVDTSRESLGLTSSGEVLWHSRRFVVQGYSHSDPWASIPWHGATLLGEGDHPDAAVLDAVSRGNAQYVAHLTTDALLHAALANGAP